MINIDSSKLFEETGFYENVRNTDYKYDKLKKELEEELNKLNK